MQLLILILHNTSYMDKILAELMKAGLRGGTLLDCEGVLQAIAHNSVEPPPIFGALRQYLNPERGETNKMLISAVSDSEAETASKIINRVTGGLDKANTGILVSVPILKIEGLAKK